MQINSNYFDELYSKKTKPSYLWIGELIMIIVIYSFHKTITNSVVLGCIDTRFQPHEIIGQPKESVFVVTNVANVVQNNDLNLDSALQYAVSVLKVSNIIICGQYYCNGIKASCKHLNNDNTSAPLEHWFRNIRDM